MSRHRHDVTEDVVEPECPHCNDVLIFVTDRHRPRRRCREHTKRPV